MSGSSLVSTAYCPTAKRHTRLSWLSIHLTMILQVARDYPGVGNVLDLPASDIRWLYAALVPELLKGGESSKGS